MMSLKLLAVGVTVRDFFFLSLGILLIFLRAADTCFQFDYWTKVIDFLDKVVPSPK